MWLPFRYKGVLYFIQKRKTRIVQVNGTENLLRGQNLFFCGIVRSLKSIYQQVPIYVKVWTLVILLLNVHKLHNMTQDFKDSRRNIMLKHVIKKFNSLNINKKD